ncbi:glycoside hydrolase family 97 C-terminal domain-containing protein [Spirosoma luteum]|uniref:glycoside hydrolase family 97 C-terminal domain-containing protein n=1 Tax=Spirosoma luteum TaxID=431553 RepID=UPI000368F3DA|nr:glycoside hydrolase family 97 C-terminal domain-containing protein [Spirosoma luteum]
MGSITNSQAREIPIKLDFLANGNYTADIYADAPNVAQNPNHLAQQTRTVSKTDAVVLKLASGGGQIIRLRGQN